jgi:hypothetical protein
MNDNTRSYRFNLKVWMTALSLNNRSIFMDKMIELSGQSKATIKRIIYMNIENQSYVRIETKEAICKVFGKSMHQLENKFTQDVEG